MFVQIMVDEVFKNVVTRMTGTNDINSSAAQNLLKNGSLLPQIKSELLQEIPKVMVVKNLSSKIENIEGTTLEELKKNTIHSLESDSQLIDTEKERLWLWVLFMFLSIIVVVNCIQRFFIKSNYINEINHLAHQHTV